MSWMHTSRVMSVLECLEDLTWSCSRDVSCWSYGFYRIICMCKVKVGVWVVCYCWGQGRYKIWFQGLNIDCLSVSFWLLRVSFVSLLWILKGQSGDCLMTLCKTRGDSIRLAPEEIFPQLVVGMLTVIKSFVYLCCPKLLRKGLLHNWCYR